jgi:hypothetical protein
MTIELINTEGVEDLTPKLLLPNGKLKLLSFKDYENMDRNAVRLFCHKNARYGLPTKELVDFIAGEIKGKRTIEIGAGHGDLGHHLGIIKTDSKIQEELSVKAFYMLGGQPTIQYPDDVRKMEAIAAVEKYKPQVVVASWVTRYLPPDASPSDRGSMFGVKEDELIKKVDTYILVGNHDIHGDKPIMQNVHIEIANKFIVSKAKNQENNRIYIFKRELNNVR